MMPAKTGVIESRPQVVMLETRTMSKIGLNVTNASTKDVFEFASSK